MKALRHTHAHKYQNSIPCKFGKKSEWEREKAFIIYKFLDAAMAHSFSPSSSCSSSSSSSFAFRTCVFVTSIHFLIVTYAFIYMTELDRALHHARSMLNVRKMGPDNDNLKPTFSDTFPYTNAIFCAIHVFKRDFILSVSLYPNVLL